MNYDLVSKMTQRISYIKVIWILCTLVFVTSGKRENVRILRNQCELKPMTGRIIGGHEATPRKYRKEYNFYFR